MNTKSGRKGKGRSHQSTLRRPVQRQLNRDRFQWQDIRLPWHPLLCGKSVLFLRRCSVARAVAVTTVLLCYCLNSTVSWYIHYHIKAIGHVCENQCRAEIQSMTPVVSGRWETCSRFNHISYVWLLKFNALFYGPMLLIVSYYCVHVSLPDALQLKGTQEPIEETLDSLFLCQLLSFKCVLSIFLVTLKHAPL